jgi:hypothetical protein
VVKAEKHKQKVRVDVFSLFEVVTTAWFGVARSPGSDWQGMCEQFLKKSIGYEFEDDKGK